MLVEIEARGVTRVMTMQSGQDNRFNPNFVAALNQALDEIEADDDARAVVVTAAQEKYFSNGIDIEWVAQSGPEAMKDFFPSFLRILARFLMFEKPVVAALNGHVFAGGFFFAMTADYRIMRDDRGWCCANEIDLGLPLCKGLLALPTYVVGNRIAERIVMTGERFTAPAAQELGIIHETAQKGELLDKAVGIADMLGMKNPKTYADYKRDMRESTSAILLKDAEEYVVPGAE